MEARVKATGRIIEVVGEGIQNSNMVMAAHGEWFTKDELDIVPLSWKPFEPTYWQKLEHQYAGMAMQSYVSNNVYLREIREMCKEPQEMRDLIADLSILLATTLVQKLKGKEERK